MDNSHFNRNLIVITAILALIVAPAAAFSVVKLKSSSSDNVVPGGTTVDTTKLKPKTPTADDLASIIQANNQTLPEGLKLTNPTVVSFRVVDNWWYIVKVKGGDSDIVLTALVSNFYNSPQQMQVITNPSERLPQYNISGFGIPYSVIEEINNS